MNWLGKKVMATMMFSFIAASPLIALANPVLMVGISEVSSVSNEVIKKLAQDTYIIDRKMADVTGDHHEDGVYLIGHKVRKEAVYADHLTLLVEDGATKEQITTELDNLGGYEGKLFLGAFSDDGKADVMVSVPTGGSGGMVDHRIISFSEGTPIVIFNQEDNKGIQLSGQFINGFQARVSSEEYGITTHIDLQSKKELYVNSQIYDGDGVVLKEVKPMSYPLASLEPVDWDRNGIYQLQGIQRIIGAYGADSIGHIYSSWRYENKKWIAENIEITAFLSYFQGKDPSGKSSLKTIVLSELDNNKEITTESGDIIQIKLKEISGTGYQWSLDSFDKDRMDVISETTEAIGNQNGIVGAPYTKVFTLKIKKIGKFNINLANVRSWENKEKAVNNFSITINNIPKGM